MQTVPGKPSARLVPVRTEKGVPGDGDALLLFQGCKVSTVVAPVSRPALIGAFAQNRCRQDARRYRLQSFKVAKFKSAKRQASI